MATTSLPSWQMGAQVRLLLMHSVDSGINKYVHVGLSRPQSRVGLHAMVMCGGLCAGYGAAPLPERSSSGKGVTGFLKDPIKGMGDPLKGFLGRKS